MELDNCISDGSSPRVWGTYNPNIERAILLRFIPTCVGNIIFDCLRYITGTVHPHVCGEHKGRLEQVCPSSGSSPRVWGTCNGKPSGVAYFRFIPTCVGNISDFLMCADFLSVHPHVCGEHGSRPKKQKRKGGSSPRVWGTYVAFAFVD